MRESGCISIGELKTAILRSKFKARKNADPRRNPNGLCLGTDHNLLFTNERTKEEYYADCEDALIPSGTCVVVRRVPGDRRRRWIDTSPIKVGSKPEDDQEKEAAAGGDSDSDSDSGMKGNIVGEEEEEEEVDMYDFGEDTLGLEKQLMMISKEEEDMVMKMKPLVMRRPFYCIGGGPSYDSSRGDSNKRQKRTVEPDEDTFKREMEAILPLTSSCGSNDVEKKKTTSIPPELQCPLCERVMKDAVFVTKCCFRSFCDRCIRGRLMTARSCACGDTDVLADNLIPNVTLASADHCQAPRTALHLLHHH